MKKLTMLSIAILGIVLAASVYADCGGCEGAAHAEKAVENVQPLCGHCGEIKGSDKCCAEGAEACAKCGLHKGSPGCCAKEKAEEAMTSSGCGEVKGSEDSCKDKPAAE